MYFDAAVVFVKKTSLLFILALAILRWKRLKCFLFPKISFTLLFFEKNGIKVLDIDDVYVIWNTTYWSCMSWTEMKFFETKNKQKEVRKKFRKFRKLRNSRNHLFRKNNRFHNNTDYSKNQLDKLNHRDLFVSDT